MLRGKKGGNIFKGGFSKPLLSRPMPEYPLMRAWRLFCRRSGTYTVNPHAGAGTTINTSLRVTSLQSSLRAATGIRNPGLRCCGSTYASMAVAHIHMYKSARHFAAEAAPVPLTGIRNPGCRPAALPVVPSDKHVSACASTASTCLPSGDLYNKVGISLRIVFFYVQLVSLLDTG